MYEIKHFLALAAIEKFDGQWKFSKYFIFIIYALACSVFFFSSTSICEFPTKNNRIEYVWVTHWESVLLLLCVIFRATVPRANHVMVVIVFVIQSLAYGVLSDGIFFHRYINAIVVNNVCDCFVLLLLHRMSLLWMRVCVCLCSYIFPPYKTLFYFQLVCYFLQNGARCDCISICRTCTLSKRTNKQP